MKQRSLDDCLNADDAIGRLSAQARRLMKLQRIVERSLPPGLARSARLANLKSGIAVVLAPSGAVAAKIRQLLPRLTESLRNAGVDLNEIRVKVQPRDLPATAQPKKSPRAIGKRQKQGLTSLASRLPEGSPLGAALQRLVARSAESTK